MSDLDAELWERLRGIFEKALERDAGTWAPLIDEACGDDPELRREVEALLAAHREGQGFLEGAQPQGTGKADPDDGLPAGELDTGLLQAMEGSRVGPYRLARRLGIGGMGAVYLATRDDGAYHKRVALKLVKPGMDNVEVLRRFEAERQILAALDHPSISRMLDGGTTREGLPYFVMEYIEGEPIDAWCDRQRLGIAGRLELFLKVCDAVRFAHQNLVVHRDLKPSNILISTAGEPKLLDFGIAKLLNPELAAPALVPTATALRLMTPDYASPEQVSGKAITTATDVYSLGVVLYELLAGRRPYDAATQAASEMVRLICDHEPPRPSEAARGVEAAGASRGTDPARLYRRLRGDLDNIVLKALSKEPARRYASVEELAADLRRHQGGQPIAARDATWPYRWGKFVRRNRLEVAASALLAMTILGFGLVMAAQRVEIARERDRAEAQRNAAEEERRRAERITDFLQDLFALADPARLDDPRSVAELLDAAERQLHADETLDPSRRAELMTTLAGIDLRLARYDRAAELAEQALALRRRHAGPRHPEVARSLDDLASIELGRGDVEAAERLYREALTLRRELFAESHAEIATSLNYLANIHFEHRRLGEAEALYRRALAMRRELLGEDHLEVAMSLNNLANVLYELGDVEGAVAHQQEALEIRRRLLPANHPEIGQSHANLAVVLWRLERLEEAESHYRSALAFQRVRFGDEHPETVRTLGNFGALLEDLGRLDEAEEAYRQVLAFVRQHLGARHPEVARMQGRLGGLAARRGRYADAEAFYGEALGILRGGDLSLRQPLGMLLLRVAEMRRGLGQAGAAESDAREARTALAASLPQEHWLNASAECVVGGVLLDLGRRGDAEPLLRRCAPRLGEAPGEEAARRHAAALHDLAALGGAPDTAR